MLKRWGWQHRNKIECKVYMHLLPRWCFQKLSCTPTAWETGSMAETEPPTADHIIHSVPISFWSSAWTPSCKAIAGHAFGSKICTSCMQLGRFFADDVGWKGGQCSIDLSKPGVGQRVWCNCRSWLHLDLTDKHRLRWINVEGLLKQRFTCHEHD